MGISKVLLPAIGVIGLITILLFVSLVCVICGFTSPYYDPLVSAKDYNASHKPLSYVTIGVSIGTLGGGDVKISKSTTRNVEVITRIIGQDPEYVSVDTSFIESDDSLKVNARTYSMTDELFNLRSTRSEITVYVPENVTCDVSISTHSGDVSVCPLEGGSLVIKDSLYQRDGKISIDGGNYTSIYVKTDERMAKGTAMVKAKYNSTNAVFLTGASDITIDADQTSGRLRATTGKGNIYIKLPETAGFSIDASSLNGRVTCDSPVQASEKDEGLLQGTTMLRPGVDLTIELQTSEGNIEIK